MAQNTGTFSATFGIKDTVDSDFKGIVNKIKLQSPLLEGALSDPIVRADRQILTVEKSLDRLMAKSLKGTFFTDRDIQTLERINTQLAEAGRIISQIQNQGGTVGSNVISRLQIAGQAAAQTSQLGMLTRPQSVPGYGPNIIDTSMIHGPANPYSMIRHKGFTGEAGAAEFQQRLFMKDRGFGVMGGSPTDFTLLQNSLQEDDALSRQKAAWTRNLDPYDNRSLPSQPLSPAVAAADKAFGKESRANQIRQSRDLEMQYKKEEEIVQRLITKYSSFSAEQQKMEHIRLRARSDAGFTTDLQQRALREVSDPFSSTNQARIGKGSYSHSYRFAAQNAAFGIEDFLISSQYGGAKAGLRAVTNNMTAIMSAVSGAMSPAMSAGLITTAALGGSVVAPAIIDYVERTAGITDEGRSEVGRQVDLRQRRIAADVAISQRERLGPNASASLTSLLSARSTEEAARSQVQANNARMVSLNNQLSNDPIGFLDKYNTALQESLGPTGMRAMNVLNPASLLLPQARSSFTTRSLESAREEYRVLSEKQPGMTQALEEARGKVASEARMFKRDFGLAQDDLVFNKQMMQDEANLRLQPFADPRDAFNLNMRSLNRRIDRVGRFGSKEEQAMNLLPLQEEQARLEANLPVQMKQFELNKQNREFQFEQDMIGFYSDPRKKAAAQLDLQTRMIEADETMSGPQKAAMLAGLQGRHQQFLRGQGSYPGVGRGIDVGSESDVLLRQRFFNKETDQTDKLADQKLTELINEVRAVKEAIKDNKPKMAAIK